eukprot:462001_1
MVARDDIKFFGTAASFVYFGLYFLLVIVITIYTHYNGEYDSKKQLAKAVWAKRGIYGQILVHIYDTATDFGVLFSWGILAYDDTDYESIDMMGLFWTSIAFVIVYRILSIVMGCVTACSNDYDSTLSEPVDAMINCCLGLFDMYIFRVVYEALTKEAVEPSAAQKMVQIVESIFESLPQVVLQSVFIIRSQNDKQLRENSSVLLVGLSLGASIFSIANKFTWLDRDSTNDKSKEAQLKAKCPCINSWYVLRVIWRFSFVTLRFAVFSLLWSVMGGAFLGIFIFCSYCYWAILGTRMWSGEFEGWIVHLIIGFMCLCATPASSRIGVAIMHVMEMIILLSLITWFALDDTIACGICANVETRQLSQNKFIQMFIWGAWAAMCIDFVSYFVLICTEQFHDSGDGALETITRFMENDIKTETDVDAKL